MLLFDCHYNLAWVSMLFYGSGLVRIKAEKEKFDSLGLAPVFSSNTKRPPDFKEDKNTFSALEKELFNLGQGERVSDLLDVRTSKSFIRLHFGKYYDLWELNDLFEPDRAYAANEFMWGNSRKPFKSGISGKRREIIDTLLSSNEQFYGILEELIQIQEIILLHFDYESFDFNIFSLQHFFDHFQPPKGQMKEKPSIQQNIVGMYQDLIVYELLCRDHYAPALAFLLLSSLLQGDFISIYPLIVKSHFSESFSFPFNHPDLGIQEIQFGPYILRYQFGKNNYNQELLCNAELHIGAIHRRLSDRFGNMLFDNNECQNLEFFQEDSPYHGDPIPFCVSTEKGVRCAPNGLLHIRFTIKEIPGRQPWFFHFILNPQLKYDLDSSAFCYSFICDNRIHDDAHTRYQVFVRETGPDAWGASLTIPPHSWWMRFYTDRPENDESWYHTTSTSRLIYIENSHEVVEILTESSGKWSQQTVESYFEPASW